LAQVCETAAHVRTLGKRKGDVGRARSFCRALPGQGIPPWSRARPSSKSGDFRWRLIWSGRGRYRPGPRRARREGIYMICRGGPCLVCWPQMLGAPRACAAPKSCNSGGPSQRNRRSGNPLREAAQGRCLLTASVMAGEEGLCHCHLGDPLRSKPVGGRSGTHSSDLKIVSSTRPTPLFTARSGRRRLKVRRRRCRASADPGGCSRAWMPGDHSGGCGFCTRHSAPGCGQGAWRSICTGSPG